MIVPEKPETYDGSTKLVMYDADEDGRCVASRQRVEFDDQINVYFEQRVKELKRLLGELMQGKISPLHLFVVYHNMTVKDLAARVRLSVGKVKHHMTPEGFGDAKVEHLKRYARVFGITVGDFFQFTHLPGSLEVEMVKTDDRLVSRLLIKTDGP